MAVLPILKAPDPRLKTKSKRVDAVDDGVRNLVADMIETMYAANGIGLAAIQVGIPKRILVIDLAREGEAPNPQVFINPEILERSEDLATYEEGCLSVPEHYAEVVRPATVRVRYLDVQGEIREQDATGLLATCLQHEIDHLDGVLFVDHLSLVKRSVILRKLAKAKKLATV